VLRGSRGYAAGTHLGSSFVERTAVNTGTFPVSPHIRAASTDSGLGPPATDRAGKGRSHRSTPGPGEPVTLGKGGSGDEKGRTQ